MARTSKAFDHSKYKDWISPEDVKPYSRNSKIHTDKQIKNIVNSIKRFGWQQDVVITSDNVLVIGHGRRLAALKIGCEMPYHIIDKTADELTDDDIRELRIADNQTNAETGFDFDTLSADIDGLDFEGFDFDFGIPADDVVEVDEDNVKSSLLDTFIVPPFSILDSRQGYWIERKKLWRDLIGDDGQARGGAEIYSKSLKDEKYTSKSTFRDTSILDPVLAEIICAWFTPGAHCKVFDCFSGDTAFGYVSSHLGHTFTGIELRQEQVDFNTMATAGMDATYICDDGRNVTAHIQEKTQDMLFSCPPYFDLEVYSDNPNDASNQATYEEFYAILDTAFSESIKCLKDNRFAVIVCGDVRNKKDGAYYNFPEDIKATFARNGMCLYNELILITAVGAAAIRSARYMENRKVAKVHQNVLVFYKGDPREIKKHFPKVEVQYDGEDLEF